MKPKPDPVEQDMRELAWRHPLTAEDRARRAAWLAQHPEVRAEWEADAALNGALSRLVAKPAPSNLTARILDQIDREVPARAGVGHRHWPGIRRWLPRLALAVAVLGGGALWHQQHRAAQEAAIRGAQAEALAALAIMTEPDAMPSVEALENFEVILKIHPAPLADTELLSMSKQLAEFKP